MIDAARANVEASKLEQSMKGYEKAAQSAGAGVQGGLNRAEQAVQSNAQRLGQLKGQIDQVNAALREETLILQGQRQYQEQAFGAGRVKEAELYANKIKETEGKLGELLVQKAQLGEQSKKLSDSLTSTTGAFDRLTTRVAVGRNLFAGADAAIEGLVRASGGIALQWSLLITLAAALLPLLSSLFKAKKNIVEIDQESATVNALLARSTGDATRVNADLLTSFSNLASQQKSYTKDTTELATKMQALESEGRIVGQVIDADGKIFRVGAQSTGELQDRIVELNKSLADQEKSLQPALESLKSLRTLYGLNTDQLLAIAERLRIFNAETEDGARIREFFREQLEKEPEALREVAKEVDKVTKSTFDLTNAARLASLAIKEIKPPQIDFGAVQGVSGAESRLNQGLRTLEAAGVEDRATQARALASEIKSLREEMMREVAAGASMAEITMRLLIPTKELLAENEKQERAYKKIHDAYTKADQLAKALAGTTSNLRKELEQANAATDAVEGGSFEARQRKAQAAYQDRVRDLQRNNQATAENLALAEAIYKAHYEKIKQDSTRAYLDIQERLAAIQGDSLQDEFARHRANIQKMLDEDIKFMREKGQSESQIHAYTILFKQAREDEYNRWRKNEYDKTLKQFVAAEQKVAGEIYHIRKKLLDDTKESTLLWFKQRHDLELNSMKEAMRLREQLERRTLSGGASDNQNFENNLHLERSIEQLRKLGLEARDVDEIFGSASLSVDQFVRRVNILQQYANGDVLGGLKSSFLDLISIQNVAMTTAGAFPNAMQEAFTQAIVYGKNFIEVFGKTLLAGILSAIGQKAIAEGTYHILAGTAKLFNPFTAADGAREIAAGVALVAFGSALVASASAITSTLNKKQASGGAGASSGQGSGGSATDSGRPEPRNVPIAFPTTGSNGGQTVIKLDRAGTRDFLEGQGVLTAKSIGSRDFPILEKAVKRMKKAS